MPSLQLPAVHNRKLSLLLRNLCIIAFLHHRTFILGEDKLTFHDKTVVEQMCGSSDLVCLWLPSVTFAGSGCFWDLPSGSEDVRERGKSPEWLLLPALGQLPAAPQRTQTRPNALPPTSATANSTWDLYSRILHTNLLFLHLAPRGLRSQLHGNSHASLKCLTLLGLGRNFA